MKKLFVITSFILILLYQHPFAQNLVPNGSFEDVTVCPNNEGQLNRARPWKNVSDGSIISSTPDLFNACTNTGVNVPNNGRGYQYANTGDGYSGMGLYSSIMTEREYIYTKATIPLDSGKRYKLKYFVSLANYSAYSIDCLGAYFSKTPIIWNSAQAIPVIPQVKNIENNFLKDTLNWMLVEGDYVATGGEQYITFGNFNNDANTNKILINDPGFCGAYYFYDDVSLYEYTDPLIAAEAGNNATICLSESAQVGNPAVVNYRYSWQPAENISDTSAAQPIVNPIHTTTYYLTQWDYMENETTDSVTITVRNCDTLSHENHLIIYPTPCNDNLFVEFSQYVPDNSRVYITNTLGQTIIKEAMLPGEKKKMMNIASLAGGVYFCRICAGNEVVRSEKMVKISR